MNDLAANAVVNYLVSWEDSAGHQCEVFADHGEANKFAEETALANDGKIVRLYQEVGSYLAETKVTMRKVGEARGTSAVTPGEVGPAVQEVA
jgi:hypothetical protein